MKLRYAMICIECDEIFEPEASALRDPNSLKLFVDDNHCPSCANGVVMRLSKWIDTMASYAEVGGMACSRR